MAISGSNDISLLQMGIGLLPVGISLFLSWKYKLVVQSINTLSIKQMRTRCLQASISSGRSPVPHSLA